MDVKYMTILKELLWSDVSTVPKERCTSGGEIDTPRSQLLLGGQVAVGQVSAFLFGKEADALVRDEFIGHAMPLPWQDLEL